MCGIYGKINTNKIINKNVDDLKAMMIESEYRGPDSQEYKVVNHVQFGFNRLAIIDLDSRSNQPFERKDLGKIIVFNGEIYNYIEIKEELKSLGYSFTTDSDTEVFLVAYHHYKEEAFNLFNGMWACCIYDYINEQVLLSRDRFGVKPLYYMSEQEGFYFASELKSLIKVKKELKRNQQAVNRFLVFGQNKFSNGETFIQNIMEHPAGTYSILIENKLNIHKFYIVPTLSKNINLGKTNSLLRECFRSSLKLRMRSDVPIALLLSGGLDSTLIAFHLNDMIEKKEIDAKKIYAFTLNFEDFEDNEWNLVQNNAKHLPHICCEPININISDFKKELSNLIEEQDLPTLSVSHLIHIFTLRQIKKKGFKVIINGQGPDEVFGGYFPIDIGYLVLDHITQNPFRAINEMRNLKKGWKYSYSKQSKLVIQAFIHKSAPKFYQRLKLLQINSLGLNKIHQNDIAKLETEYTNEGYYAFRSKTQIFDKQFNGILNYEDMTSMLNSLEMRSPFLDYRIVNLGLSLPASIKLKDGYSKWILREALGDLLPDDIRWSNWKLGYPVPKHQLMNEIMPKNIKWDETNFSLHWRSYNLERWFNNYKVGKV